MIHPTAIVDRAAEIDETAELGPYVVVEGRTTIGARTRVHAFAALGGPPQDRSYAGEDTRLVIGSDAIVREHVTIHRGTVKGSGETRVGDRCYVMAASHIGHDCVLGDDVTLAGGTMLAGHVVLEDFVTTGGSAALAQFVHVGTTAFVAAGARVEHDVPPYHIAQGDRARVRALNEVGLSRRGIDASALRRAHRALYRSGRPIDVVLQELDISDPHVARLADFLRTHTCVPGLR